MRFANLVIILVDNPVAGGSAGEAPDAPWYQRGAGDAKEVPPCAAVARGGVTCPAALVSADDKTYYSYAAQMSYAAYQALNP